MRRIHVNYCGDENYNDHCKDIYIKDTYNPVAVKRKINQKIYINPKEIQLYRTPDNYGLLDDNHFIPEDAFELYWKKTDENPNHIILIIQKNEFGLPKRIQVSQTDTIQSIIILLSNVRETQIQFTIFDENGTQLSPLQTVIECNLIDNSIIKVWNSEDLGLLLNICSIIDRTNIITDSFHICTKISDVKRVVTDRLKLDPPIILFSELSYFDNDKRLIDYFIQNGDNIYYFKLLMSDKIVQGDELKNRKFSKLFVGRIEMTNEDLILNRYKKNDLKMKYFKYEITSLLLLSNATNCLFVTLVSMYEQNDRFYIATEFSSRESLKSKYKTQSVSEDDIITYFIQVCEAVVYMHDIKMIHRNIKCSSILLCANNNIKLCNFHKAKYLDHLTTQQFNEGVPGSIIEDDIWWVAPEVLNCEPYGSKSDIWSLGAAMIEILTRKHPHHPLNSSQAIKVIKENKIIGYEQNCSPRLSQIIEKCVYGESNLRLNAYKVREKLLQALRD